MGCAERERFLRKYTTGKSRNLPTGKKKTLDLPSLKKKRCGVGRGGGSLQICRDDPGGRDACYKERESFYGLISAESLTSVNSERDAGRRKRNVLRGGSKIRDFRGGGRQRGKRPAVSGEHPGEEFLVVLLWGGPDLGKHFIVRGYWNSEGKRAQAMSAAIGCKIIGQEGEAKKRAQSGKSALKDDQKGVQSAVNTAKPN